LKRAQASKGQQQTNCGAAERKQDAFCKQLLYEPAVSRTQAEADCYFMLPGTCSGQQYVGDVDSCDEQHRTHRCKHHQQRRAEIPDQIVAQRFDRHGEPGIRARIGSLNVASDNVRFGLSTLQSHARSESGNSLEEERSTTSDSEMDRLP